MQELHQLVLVDDLARRGGEIGADLEGAEVGLTDAELAAASGDIAGEVLETLDQVRAIAGQRQLQDLGIGEGEIRRRQRIGDLIDIEARHVLGVRVADIGIGHRVLGPAHGQQIGLLQEIEDLVLLPVGVEEALVAGFGARHRLDRRAEEAFPRRIPQPGMHAPQLELGIDQLVGMFEISLEYFTKGTDGSLELLGGAGCHFGLTLAIFRQGGDDLAGLLDGASHVAQEGGGIGQPEIARQLGFHLGHGGWGSATSQTGSPCMLGSAGSI